MEALTGGSIGALAEPGKIFFAVVGRIVVFSRNIEHLFRFSALQQLTEGIELGRLCRVSQIAGMDQKFGRRGKPVDFIDCNLQRAVYIGVGRFVEADMAVADLYEMKSL